MTPLILFLLWALVCAEKEATEDFKLIAANKPVHHTVAEWWERAQIVLLGGLVCVTVGLFMDGVPYFRWKLLLWLPAGWAAFTSGFRWFLNRKSKLDWRYVSPSNLYDFGFMVFTGIGRRPHKEWRWNNWRKCLLNYHWINYEMDADYKAAIHRAGTLEYIVELSILTASTITYAWL